MAQLVARMNGIHETEGSNPSSSIFVPLIFVYGEVVERLKTPLLPFRRNNNEKLCLAFRSLVDDVRPVEIE